MRIETSVMSCHVIRADGMDSADILAMTAMTAIHPCHPPRTVVAVVKKIIASPKLPFTTGYDGYDTLRHLKMNNELTNQIKAAKANIKKQYAEEKVKRQMTTEPTKYRTDEPNPHPNYWKYTESIWIEKLDGMGEGSEHYQLISKDKYFEMGLEGLIVDFEELGLYQPEA